MKLPEGEHTQILALREAGEVERFHTVRHLGTYSVARHCYNMACMALVLYPDPAHLPLILEACLTHDLPERWCGDIPAPVKVEFPELGDIYSGIEEETHAVAGVRGPTEFLYGKDLVWLRCLDLAELWLWSREQVALGNEKFRRVMVKCEEWIENLDAPREFTGWWLPLINGEVDYHLTDIPW